LKGTENRTGSGEGFRGLAPKEKAEEKAKPKADFSLRSPTASREVKRKEKASGCSARNDGGGGA
jgi:hypothetical protein